VSFFYVDDEFPECPKLDDIPAKNMTSAVGLWCLAGAWSRKKLTGGAIPSERIEKLGGTHREADFLVKCKLWLRTDTGYQFHDWEEWQETPEEVEEKRRQTKIRVRKWRAANPRNGVTKALQGRYERVSNAPGNADVLRERERGGTYGGEAREEIAVEPLPPTGDARVDSVNSDLGLVRPIRRVVR
jgi:hypothetical protein